MLSNHNKHISAIQHGYIFVNTIRQFLSLKLCHNIRIDIEVKYLVYTLSLIMMIIPSYYTLLTISIILVEILAWKELQSKMKSNYDYKLTVLEYRKKWREITLWLQNMSSRLSWVLEVAASDSHESLEQLFHSHAPICSMQSIM